MLSYQIHVYKTTDELYENIVAYYKKKKDTSFRFA